MKKRNFINSVYFLGILCICLAGLGCKKYIYQGPINSTYSSQFWTSQNAVEKAVNSIYGQLRGNLVQPPNNGPGTFFLNGDMVSGSFENLNRQDYMPLTATHDPFNDPRIPFNFNYTPYNQSLHDWSSFYQLIAQCNLILQNVPVMSSSLFTSEVQKNSYLGEVLFIRAYTYFYITRIWGDPVVVSKTYDGSDYGNIPPLPRTPEAIVLDSCISDLLKASTYLEFAKGEPSSSLKANKGSIFALLAHIYAWKHDYVNAHQACLKVINNGGYSLEPLSTYKNIWAGQSSPENIFELSMTFQPNDPNFSNGGAWAEAKFDFFGVFLKGSIVDGVKKSSWTTPPAFFEYDTINKTYNKWDTAVDKRFKIDYVYYPAGEGDPDGFMLLKYTNFEYAKPDTKTSPYINNNLVLFRLSDIILLDAEALASTGDFVGAAAALEQTESRAGITYEGSINEFDLLNEIIKERGRELVGEGQWFYDLIRTNEKLGWLERVGYPKERVNKINKGYYWPLDMEKLLPQDNLLTQNPWWSTHIK